MAEKTYFAEKVIQTAIKAVVDATKVVVDSIKATVDSTKTKVDSIDIKVGTILDGRVVKSVQRGFVTTAPTPAINYSVSISAVNVNKTVVLINGVKTSSSFIFPVYLNSLTSTQFTVTGSVSSNTPFEFTWQVIEFY